MDDYLNSARKLLEGIRDDYSIRDKLRTAEMASYLASVAQAEAMQEHNELLEIQAEHLEYIRGHLDDIGTVLLNAAGPDDAIKSDGITWDAATAAQGEG